MNGFLRIIFFALIVRPLVFIVIGLNIRNRHRLPDNGPSILIANHNSHLDTLVLMSLYPLSKLRIIHPVAAADYFFRNKVLAWFSSNIIGIIPLNRGQQTSDSLKPIETAIQDGQIILLFPEGSRGNPEQLSKFKGGIWHLSKRVPEVPVIPIFLHGLGKALPKGEAIFVPFFCDIFVGNPILSTSQRSDFMDSIEKEFQILADQGGFTPWE